MNIAIFGAGIAGLMTALTLTRSGHQCRIYERNPDNLDAGMGFILMPDGRKRLEQFGVTITGKPLDQFCQRNPQGKIIHNQIMPDGAISVRRKDAIEAIFKVLPKGMVTFGAGLDGLEFNEDQKVVAARLNSNEVIEADLFVAADGTRSKARQVLFPQWPAQQARVMEIVGLTQCEEVSHWAGHTLNKFSATSGGLAFGLLPVVDSEQLVWYLQFDAQKHAPIFASTEERKAFIENTVGRWANPIPSLLCNTDFSKAHLWRPMDTDVVPCFHHGNLALVGDAAHPLLPFTSQGVSSAICDAVALSNWLSSSNDIVSALTCYSIERRAHCAPYVEKGRELTRHFLAPQKSGNCLLPVAQ